MVCENQLYCKLSRQTIPRCNQKVGVLDTVQKGFPSKEEWKILVKDRAVEMETKRFYEWARADPRAATWPYAALKRTFGRDEGVWNLNSRRSTRALLRLRANALGLSADNVAFQGRGYCTTCRLCKAGHTESAVHYLFQCDWGPAGAWRAELLPPLRLLLSDPEKATWLNPLTGPEHCLAALARSRGADEHTGLPKFQALADLVDKLLEIRGL